MGVFRDQNSVDAHLRPTWATQRDSPPPTPQNQKPAVTFIHLLNAQMVQESKMKGNIISSLFLLHHSTIQFTPSSVQVDTEDSGRIVNCMA